MTAKICTVIKSFGKPSTRHPHNIRQIGLPKKQILYTVLRSPHIDKKSREQFGMRIHKELPVIETETQKLREKLLWLKFHHPLGVQLKILFHYQTSLDFVQLWMGQIASKSFFTKKRNYTVFAQIQGRRTGENQIKAD